jgi:hypothetical protein
MILENHVGKAVELTYGFSMNVINVESQTDETLIFLILTIDPI